MIWPSGEGATCPRSNERGYQPAQPLTPVRPGTATHMRVCWMAVNVDSQPASYLFKKILFGIIACTPFV